MSRLREALTDYLGVRRALGFKLQRAEKLLDQLLTYVEECGETQLRLPTLLAWATQPGHEQSGWPAYRLAIVRRFAFHLHAIDPATEVPPVDVLPWRQGRATPYLYSDDEVTSLLAVAATLRTTYRVATYRTLIRLLVVTPACRRGFCAAWVALSAPWEREARDAALLFAGVFLSLGFELLVRERRSS